MKNATALAVTAWIAVLAMIGAVAVFAYLALEALRGEPLPLGGFIASILLGNTAALVLQFCVRARRRISHPPANRHG